MLSISTNIWFGVNGVDPSLVICSIIRSFVIGDDLASSVIVPSISIVFVLSVIESVLFAPILALNDMLIGIFFSVIFFNS